MILRRGDCCGIVEINRVPVAVNELNPVLAVAVS
jgi:hypothetical protein